MTLLEQLAAARFGALEAARWNNGKAAQYYRELADSIAERLIAQVVANRTVRKAA
jgi:hypothetical protein